MCDLDKYVTREIDYTGCHPVIAQALKAGRSILCEVGSELNPRQVFISAYRDFKSHFKYRQEGYSNGWVTAEPVVKKVKKTIVLPLEELMPVLLAQGYKPDVESRWIYPVIRDWGSAPPFNHKMFLFCGHSPSTDYEWHPKWLKEIEVSESS